MMAQVRCFKCKQLGQKKDCIKYNAHYYHPDCYSLVLEKEEFDRCVCQIFGLISPGPRILTQRKRLLAQGYDDISLIRALKYIYEVKKIPVPKDKYDDNVGLGLVPKFSQEAEDYFDKQQQQRQRIALIMADALEKEKQKTEVITVHRNINKKTVQLLSMVEPEEEN